MHRPAKWHFFSTRPKKRGEDGKGGVQKKCTGSTTFTGLFPATGKNITHQSIACMMLPTSA